MKDRSFIYRQRQSQAAKADNLRRFGPAQIRDEYPAPKASLWTQIVLWWRIFLKWWNA